MSEQPYHLQLPENPTSCVVFNSGHSGSEFPAEFLENSGLSLAELRSSEDAFVDQLVADAPDFGAPVISAKYSRAFVDLNRGADELDPAIISGLPRRVLKQRVSVGLGVLPRVVAHGKVIQRGKISRADAMRRLDDFYHPYHAALKNLTMAQKQRHGFCLLVDFHSMPREALHCNGQISAFAPDIVLGDRFGISCDRWIIDEIENIFSDAGFRVARNAPFAGGYFTQHYGKPRKQIHAIQIEICRSLYMAERQITPLPDFKIFKERIKDIVRKISGLGPATLNLAAE